MDTPTENTIDIYISFARHDLTKAEYLAHALEAEGMVVFGEWSNLRDEEKWNYASLQVLKDARCVIVVWSTAALESNWVKSEARFALENSKLLPIRIDASQPPIEFAQLSTLDFSNWNGERTSTLFLRLKDALMHLFGMQNSTDIGTSKTAWANQSNVTAKPELIQKKTLKLPDIDWVEIPAGPFIYGKDSASGYGKGYGKSYDHGSLSELQSFFISRYPITHCQFQTFIDAGGYQGDRWWRDLIRTRPTKAKWQQANRPRETVDWYEAMAFCRWLSAELGYTITLPTEQQWEKAARGTDGREYPWGASFDTGDANVFLDSNPENLNQTCAVGLFPHRASPYQVMDMAGNVWEWCLNQFDRPDQIEPNTSHAPRVLRGGYWDLKALDARTFIRRSRHPDLRDYDVGFRVVRLSP